MTRAAGQPMVVGCRLIPRKAGGEVLPALVVQQGERRCHAKPGVVGQKGVQEHAFVREEQRRQGIARNVLSLEPHQIDGSLLMLPHEVLCRVWFDARDLWLVAGEGGSDQAHGGRHAAADQEVDLRGYVDPIHAEKRIGSPPVLGPPQFTDDRYLGVEMPGQHVDTKPLPMHEQPVQRRRRLKGKRPSGRGNPA